MIKTIGVFLQEQLLGVLSNERTSPLAGGGPF